MIKEEKKVALTMVIFVLIALAVIVGYLINRLNCEITIILVSVCLVIIFAVFSFWKRKSDKFDKREIIELESNRKVNNRTTRNIFKIILSILLFFNFYIFFCSTANVFYSLIFLVVYFVVNIIFLAPRHLVIDNNAIYYYPNWKIKWTELKSYKLSKTSGFLSLEKLDGQTKQVKGIMEKDFDNIENLLKQYII